MKKVFFNFLVWLVVFFSVARLSPTAAVEGLVLGVHILEASEVAKAGEFVDSDREYWSYVTVPIRLDQLDRQVWQDFFDKAEENRLIPLVRLVTSFDGKAWSKPTRAEVVRLADFLSSLSWPSDRRHVILFNEPNHAAEWGGRLDPEGYAEVADFAADWFHTEGRNYVVLPAGLDASAGDTAVTMDSLRFLERMFAYKPGLVDKFDGWTSHAYANPGFSGSAYSRAKNGLLSWQYELSFLEKFTEKDLPVYITETGWDQSKVSKEKLVDYYSYALENVWSDERVVAVTPFILSGNGGIFDAFSFFNADGSPTPQMEALEMARERLRS